MEEGPCKAERRWEELDTGEVQRGCLVRHHTALSDSEPLATDKPPSYSPVY